MLRLAVRRLAAGSQTRIQCNNIQEYGIGSRPNHLTTTRSTRHYTDYRGPIDDSEGTNLKYTDEEGCPSDTPNFPIATRFLPPPPDSDFPVQSSRSEFHWVHRLLPLPIFPRAPSAYPDRTRRPSGWVPPPPTPPTGLPYHVQRTRYQNLPVYRRTRAGGSQRITVVRSVSGDAYRLAEDIDSHLRQLNLNRKLSYTVDEVVRQITFKGFWDEEILIWLQDKGF